MPVADDRVGAAPDHGVGHHRRRLLRGARLPVRSHGHGSPGAGGRHRRVLGPGRDGGHEPVGEPQRAAVHPGRPGADHRGPGWRQRGRPEGTTDGGTTPEAQTTIVTTTSRRRAGRADMGRGTLRRTFVAILVAVLLVGTAGASVWLMASSGVLSLGGDDQLPGAPESAGGSRRLRRHRPGGGRLPRRPAPRSVRPADHLPDEHHRPGGVDHDHRRRVDDHHRRRVDDQHHRRGEQLDHDDHRRREHHEHHQRSTRPASGCRCWRSATRAG